MASLYEKVARNLNKPTTAAENRVTLSNEIHHTELFPIIFSVPTDGRLDTELDVHLSHLCQIHPCCKSPSKTAFSSFLSCVGWGRWFTLENECSESAKKPSVEKSSRPAPWMRSELTVRQETASSPFLKTGSEQEHVKGHPVTASLL